MQNITGSGTEVIIKGSVTFPQGFSFTQFADDSDPFDIPEVQIAETAMGVNSDLVVWSSPNPIALNIASVPNGEDDINLGILYEANRVQKGKKSARDVITITVIYPDGSKVTFGGGAITNGTPANSVASAGRIKTKTYGFAFESIS